MYAMRVHEESASHIVWDFEMDENVADSHKPFFFSRLPGNLGSMPATHGSANSSNSVGFRVYILYSTPFA
jgi:hypothetical protein